MTLQKSGEIPRMIQRYCSMIGNLTNGFTGLVGVVTVNAMSSNPALAIQTEEPTNRVLGSVDTIGVFDQQLVEYLTSFREFEKLGERQFTSRNHH